MKFAGYGSTRRTQTLRCRQPKPNSPQLSFRTFELPAAPSCPIVHVTALSRPGEPVSRGPMPSISSLAYCITCERAVPSSRMRRYMSRSGASVEIWAGRVVAITEMIATVVRKCRARADTPGSRDPFALVGAAGCGRGRRGIDAERQTGEHHFFERLVTPPDVLRRVGIRLVRRGVVVPRGGVELRPLRQL